MELSELKARLSEAEAELEERPLVELGRFETTSGALTVAITDRLRRSCRKGRVWKSNAMLTALKNVHYGFDRTRARSRGGSDGIFLLDRNFKPPNEMMRKLFDRFLDKPDPLVGEIEAGIAVRREDFLPVRVVSHHMRLLGVLVHRQDGAHLVLVDYDAN